MNRGWRLAAQSCLPIDNETLIYGTSDGGSSFHHRNKELNAKLLLAAQILNIGEEVVWDADELREHHMNASCDIEGHKGKDNRFYLVGKHGHPFCN